MKLLIFLISLGSFATKVIPTDPTDCLKLVEKIGKLMPTEKKEYFTILGEMAERITSSEDLAQFLVDAYENGFKKKSIEPLLLNSPYIKELNIKNINLASVLFELDNHSGEISLDKAYEKMAQYFHGYRNGIKKLSKERTYDLEMDDFPIHNQGRLGSCWVYGCGSTLERFLEKHFGEKVSFAIELYYANYISHALKENLMEKFQDPRIIDEAILPKYSLFDEGGFFANFFAWLPEFGIAPEYAYKPLRKYQTSQHKKRFIRDLRLVIQAYNEEHDRLSSFAGRIIKRKQFKELNFKTAKKLDTVIRSYAGDLQPEFEYLGETYTPKSFYQNWVAPHVNGLTMYRRSNSEYSRNSLPTVDFYDDTLKRQRISVSVTQMYKRTHNLQKVIIDHLDKGDPLYVSIKIPTSTHQNKTGKSVTIIDSVTGKATTQNLDSAAKIRGGHALVIVDYELDHQGSIKTLKFQNSWGELHGDQGYLHADESFFWDYVNYVGVIR